MAKMLNNLVANVVGSGNGSNGGNLVESKLVRGGGDAYLVSMMATDIIAEAKKTVDDHGEEGGDLVAQLAQKENDLVLAAELGKALLDKNEELQRQNDSLEQGYAQRIEVRRGIALLSSFCNVDVALAYCIRIEAKNLRTL